MNIFYAKSVLYAYPKIEEILDQIDDIIEKRALSSMTDYSPAQAQCEKILALIEQKDSLIKLKLIVDSILKKFKKDEFDCFDYKYFHFRKKEEFNDFDSSSRGYFRKQIRIATRFSERLEKGGITDEKFKEEFLSTEFFRELLKRVIEHEKNFYKNKPKDKKVISCKGIISGKLPAKRTLERKVNLAVTDSKLNYYS